ncbi:MAG: formylmethanofuran dehydrogenase subunit E family protein [Deltaproteobacteria bacterium]|nr:formylmethanofuran dehydrogenase subunit E family protein [Deltaproteobacteria bacterium]
MPKNCEQNCFDLVLDTPWCRDFQGNPYTFEEYVALIRDFHGHPAPGLLIGGAMVDLALQHLPEGVLFDAICETHNCLPDAVQLLTPCTVGNGWLKVLSLGRFSLAFYDKFEGKGIRVFLDPEKLESWPEIRDWFFKRKPKKEQDSERLLQDIRAAGSGHLGLEQVQVKPDLLIKQHLGPTGLCPLCKEAYPLKHGARCLACQGEDPYRPRHT